MKMYLVRWKVDKNLLGVFAAKTLDDLAYSFVDQFLDPAGLEYFVVSKGGGFIFDKGRFVSHGDNVVAIKESGDDSDDLNGMEANWSIGDYINGGDVEEDEDPPEFMVPQATRLVFTEGLDDEILDARKWKSLEDPETRERLASTHNITNPEVVKGVAQALHGVKVDD